MEQSRIRAASNNLWQLWQNQICINELPQNQKPTTKKEGYAIQALLDNRSFAPICGWKIAATSFAGQSHIGVSGPMAGRLLQERMHKSGGNISISQCLMKVAEAEFAFRMNADLPPRGKPYTVEEVLGAVSHLHPAIEIPDSRFTNFADVGEAELIADNACAHEFILGEPSCDSWKTIDLKAHSVEIRTTKPQIETGTGKNVLGDPRIALTWLVNELLEFGTYVKQNQIITTGTTTIPISIETGIRVFAEFGELGSVSAVFDD
jgi:2-keto-4-pentenoate hydratase